MSADVTPEQRAEWAALAEAATPGPWEHEGARSGHRLLAAVTAPSVPTGDGTLIAVTVEVLPPDAAFIAAARTAMPALLAENARLRNERLAFTDRLGFGDDRTEPAATLEQMLDPIEQAFSDAHEHIECPVICEPCGETLARATCEHCYGSGCGPGTASGAYSECEWCAGVGKVHVGCVEQSYVDLAADNAELRAALEAAERDRDLAETQASNHAEWSLQLEQERDSLHAALEARPQRTTVWQDASDEGYRLQVIHAEKQRDIALTELATRLDALGDERAENQRLRDGITERHNEAYPGAGWCAGCHDAAKADTWPCETLTLLNPTERTETECVCPPDICLGTETDTGSRIECAPCLALDPELPCLRDQPTERPTP